MVRHTQPTCGSASNRGHLSVIGHKSLTLHDVEDLRRRIDAALDGRGQTTGNTRMADYDWSGVARMLISVSRHCTVRRGQ